MKKILLCSLMILILVACGGGCPCPNDTPDPEPTDTPTPEPNDTPEPTDTPESNDPSAQTPWHCVDFESPQFPQTAQYGYPVQKPGDVVIYVFPTDINHFITVKVLDFKESSTGPFPGVFGLYNYAEIDNVSNTVTYFPSFGADQILKVGNINLEFDFSQIGFQPSQITFEFVDFGGNENLSINGDRQTIFIGDLFLAPASIGIAGVVVDGESLENEGTMYANAGLVTLTGAVNMFAIGGQEFWIDNVCAQE